MNSFSNLSQHRHAREGGHLVYCPITDKEESLKAYQTFKNTFSDGAESIRDLKTGWQGGGTTIDEIFLHKERDVWGILHPRPPKSVESQRYWFCFGTGHPEKNTAIVVEINPPHTGINKRLGGIFLKDEDDNIYLAHTGKIGGGRTGIGYDAFATYCQSQKKNILNTKTFIPDLEKDVLVLGNIEDTAIISSISDFTHLVKSFKSHATGGKS